jgi:hypothetical protein
MDLCCGLTMVGILKSVFTDGAVWMHDVPFLFCPTCETLKLAPAFELDYTLHVHHCETDGVKSANFGDAVGPERLLAFLEQYPEDSRITENVRVTQEQIDMALDMILLLRETGDREWLEEWINRLRYFQQLRVSHPLA